ncbi:hypothetical protein GGR52DRAFT_589066 [Hypoxylon sp. FL1284]|nr:hypothetical protein GGR52DRAFT_589066 [Hypoxylon sp. FL1284]
MRTSKRGVVSAATPSARLRQAVVVSVMCLALYCFLLVPEHSLDSSRTVLETNPSSISSPSSRQQKLPRDVLENRSLTAAQCATAFPGLTAEIDDAVSRGGAFELPRSYFPPDGAVVGPLVVARVRDGRLTILARARRVDLSADALQHRAATLHQVAAALLTAPPDEPVPDAVLALCHGDDPRSPSLSYARPADPSLSGGAGGRRYFAMPHFSFWGWPIAPVGSFARAAAAIARVESALPAWADKDPRAAWRGTTWFAGARAARLRHDLVNAARGRPWADVEPLLANRTNALAIEDFCRYRYVVHTEGVTYSGRFQFHQLCASVVLTPPIAWMQHLTHLARPVFSYDLDGVQRTPPGPGPAPAANMVPYPANWVKEAWPTSYDPRKEANIVFVAPDWSDLEATVEWLERHPKVAEGIARRQRELFDGGGYFSPAAEMCYWRAAIRGWSEVARADEKELEGMEEIPWEEFSITEIHK